MKHLAKKFGRGSQTVNLSKLVKMAKNGGIEPNIRTNSGVDSCWVVTICGNWTIFMNRTVYFERKSELFPMKPFLVSFWTEKYQAAMNNWTRTENIFLRFEIFRAFYLLKAYSQCKNRPKNTVRDWVGHHRHSQAFYGINSEGYPWRNCDTQMTHGPHAILCVAFQYTISDLSLYLPRNQMAYLWRHSLEAIWRHLCKETQ